jgi:hypothetical protein
VENGRGAAHHDKREFGFGERVNQRPEVGPFRMGHDGKPQAQR